MLIVLVQVSFAQTLVNKEWVQLNGVPDSIDYSASALDDNGNLYVTTNTVVAGQQANILTMKYDREGNLIWQDTYNGTFNGKDYGTALCFDANGDVIVVGVSQTSAIGSEIKLFKYSPTGTLQWNTTFSNGFLSAASAVATDATNHIYLTGLRYMLGSQTDYLTAKFKPTGSLLWDVYYDYANLQDAAVGIEVNPSTGNVYVTGASESAPNNYDYATLEYDASGNLINTNRTSAPGTGFDKVQAFARDNAGNLYLTGTAYNTTTNSYDIKTLKLNASLAVQWIQTYDAAGLEDVGNSLAIDNQGNVVVAGYVSTHNQGKDFITLKYDAGGSLLWKQGYNNYEYIKDDEIKKIKIDYQGFIIVIGSSETLIGADFVLLKYDNDGNLKYLESFGDKNTPDVPLNIDINNTGDIYVTGKSSSNTSINNVIIKYENVEIPFDVYYSTQGKPLYLKNQIIVRFRKDAFNPNIVDNLDIKYGEITKFLTVNTINQLNTVLPFNINKQTCIKIFKGLTTNDSISISRIGKAIKVPDFWTSMVLTLPPSVNEQAICNILNNQPNIIKYAHLNRLAELKWAPLDFFYNRQAGLHACAPNGIFYANAHINLENAWELTQGEEFVKIGIFDSNIDWKHTDFCYDPTNGLDTPFVKVKGWDFALNTNLYNAPRGNDTHGTMVAGIIGAWNNSNFGTSPFGGIAGICGGDATNGNKGALLYSMAVLPNGYLLSSISLMAEAFVKGSVDLPNSDYGYGLHIFNNSWGLEDYNWQVDSLALIRDAVHHANRNGVIFCAARGNEGIDNPICPAIFDDDWVLSVSGTNEDGLFHPSSSYGHKVDVAAPYAATINYTTNFFNGINPADTSYIGFFGTSAACPYVAGTAGLMLSYVNTSFPDYNNLVHEDVEYILQRTADDVLPIGNDDTTGYGKLNAGNALHLLEKPLRYVRHFDSEVFPSIKNVQYSGTTNIHLTEMADNTATGSVFLSGNYQADVYKITTTITHNLAANENIYLDYYWSRPSSSTTISEPDSSANPFDVLPHEKAYITNINNSTAEMEGYAYQIYLGGSPVGWLPYNPFTQLDSFQFAYSILVENLAVVGSPYSNKGNVGIRLYPNPSTESHTLVILANKEDNIRITRYNSQGQNIGNVYEGQLHKGSNELILSVSELSQGLYFYRIETSQCTTNQKFVKK